jgi:hypothetical protein
MLYQLPNGKVIHLSIEEYLDLTDLDIQYLMSIDYGDTVLDPFSGSAINSNAKEIYYDFSSLSIDDEELNNIYQVIHHLMILLIYLTIWIYSLSSGI